MSRRNVRAGALAALTHTPVSLMQQFVSPAAQGGVTPYSWLDLGTGDLAVATYLGTKIAANIVAVGAAVRQYKYSVDAAAIADSYSKLATARRTNYDTVFAPKEAQYIHTVAGQPVYTPQYQASDLLASEVTIFSVYERMRKTTPELATNQRDNASFGVAMATADLMDYGRRREEYRSDMENEDRLNILQASAQFAFGAGVATGNIAMAGSQRYINAKEMTSVYGTNVISSIRAGFLFNIESARYERQRLELARRSDISVEQAAALQRAQAPADRPDMPKIEQTKTSTGLKLETPQKGTGPA